MNFNTTNSTFRQLMGNGMSYRVPLFQRDYSWGGDEWDDLWQDLVALFGEDPEPAHYMGYLVLQSADNRTFDVIDGQQHMTTLSLLMLAAVAHLTDLAVPADPADPQRRRAEQLRSNYIGYLDPVSLVPRSKLTLNRHNDRFYQNYLVPLESLPQRGLNASEHLLRRAFLWFRERIKDRSGDDGEPRTRNSGRRLQTRGCEQPVPATIKSCALYCSGSKLSCRGSTLNLRAQSMALSMCCQKIRATTGTSSTTNSGRRPPTV